MYSRRAVRWWQPSLRPPGAGGANELCHVGVSAARHGGALHTGAHQQSVQTGNVHCRACSHPVLTSAAADESAGARGTTPH